MSETKVEQHPENAPEVVVELEKLQQARLQAISTAALASVGCKTIPLCLPAFVDRMKIDPETGDAVVLDEDGAIRKGITPVHWAREFRAAFVGKGPFFNA